MAESQSVYLGVEPTLWTLTRYCFLFKSLGLEFVVLSLWREAESVLCESQSSHLSVCTFTIHTYTLYNTYNIYKVSFSPASDSRLCPTTH
jgi:hypothetical protein